MFNTTTRLHSILSNPNLVYSQQVPPHIFHYLGKILKSGFLFIPTSFLLLAAACVLTSAQSFDIYFFSDFSTVFSFLYFFFQKFLFTYLIFNNFLYHGISNLFLSACPIIQVSHSYMARLYKYIFCNIFLFSMLIKEEHNNFCFELNPIYLATSVLRDAMC